MPDVARLEFLPKDVSPRQGGKRKGESGNVYRRAGRSEGATFNLRGVLEAPRSLHEEGTEAGGTGQAL